MKYSTSLLDGLGVSHLFATHLDSQAISKLRLALPRAFQIRLLLINNPQTFFDGVLFYRLDFIRSRSTIDFAVQIRLKARPVLVHHIDSGIGTNFL